MQLYHIDGKTYPVDPHQLEGLQHLRDNPRAGLFWEMSLSKTAVVLLYISEMRFGATLIIAPDKVARITWPKELRDWKNFHHLSFSVVTGNEEQRRAALDKRADIYTIGAQNSVWLFNEYFKKKSGKWVGALPFDYIVFDESTLFKSNSSERFKKMRRAVRSIEYRTILTGTPIPNGEIDLWSQICLLDDGERLGHTFGEYVDKFFTTRGNGMITYEYKPKKGAARTIAKIIGDIVSAKNTRDHVKLPKLRIVDEVLEFDGFEKEIYEYLEKEYVLENLAGEDITVKSASDLSNKLLQLTSGAVYYMEEGRRYYMELNTLKLDTLGELFEEHPDENFIIVYQFQHEVERIIERFPWVELFKTESQYERWNAGEIRGLLGHPAGMGHGLNMQYGGRRMVMFSVTWNLEHYAQVISRILRRGLEGDMWLHRLLVRGTRDMKVRARLGTKQTNQQFLMNEVKELMNKYDLT
jgi:SNF2 family DNA or RNA helicase